MRHGREDATLDTSEPLTVLQCLLLNTDAIKERRSTVARVELPGEKIESALWVSLTSFKSRTSTRSRLISASSSLVGPGPHTPVDLGLQNPLAQRLGPHYQLPGLRCSTDADEPRRRQVRTGLPSSSSVTPIWFHRSPGSRPMRRAAEEKYSQASLGCLWR